MTFDFDLILVFFLIFGVLMGYFWRSGYDSKTVLGCTHVVKQLLFSMFSFILTFNFDLIFGSFFEETPLLGYFWGP